MTDYLDHLCVASSRAAALALFPHLTAETEEGETVWTAQVFEPLALITQYAVWDYADPENPVETTPQEQVPGYWFTLSLHKIDPLVTASPACRLVTSRERFRNKTPGGFWMHTAADFDMATLAVVLDISPQIAGTQYPIGS